MLSTERLIELAKKTSRVVLIKGGKIAGIVNVDFAGGSPAYNSFIYDRCSSCEEEPRTKTNGGLK